MRVTFRLHFLPHMQKLWYGGKYYMDFVGNLLIFTVVKEF